MICLGKIGQFKIDGKRFGDSIGISKGESTDDLFELCHPVPFVRRIFSFRASSLDAVTMLAGEQAQSLDRIEEILSLLLLQYLPEQTPQRAYIPAKRQIFLIQIFA